MICDATSRAGTLSIRCARLHRRTVLVGVMALLLCVTASAQDGLLGEYFDDLDLTVLADTRVDPQIDFTTWGSQPAGTAVIADNSYSERWTGWVLVDQAGDWTFTTHSNDGVRLFVDEQQVIVNWTAHSATDDSGTINLSAGWHPIRLEHFQDGGSVVLQLSFAGPGTAQQIIPPSNLATAVSGNLPPTLELGEERYVVLPDGDIVLPGLGQDVDGHIIDVNWIQVSGTAAILKNTNTSLLSVSGLTSVGTRVFQCSVTDDGGATATDVVSVQVVDCGTPAAISANPTMWQRVTLDFTGPSTSEGSGNNPFLNYRLDVTFIHAWSGERLVVPGFYAANGNAAETSASSGSVWRTHFSPPDDGTWVFVPSFRTGADVAVADNPLAGTPTAFDGQLGCFSVAYADPSAPGFLSKGRLEYVNEHYLRHAQSKDRFLKGGANSPENLLAFADFDQTTGSHQYAPHLGDWNPGDPSWKNGKGKGLIGGLNYLAGKGMNAVYFLSYNVGGDGDDVWPFTGKTARLRYDCSKLEQWEIVFDHMDRLGIVLHVVTQEQENDNGQYGLDGGSLGTERKLYYRELVARFSHHLGVIWNLGEENSNTSSQRREFYDYIHGLDPYDHPIVVHSFPDQQASVYGPLLDTGRMEGASLQNMSVQDVHSSTLNWYHESSSKGRPWVLYSDELGPGNTGVVPDSVDYWHDSVRQQGLWGNLMAGGAGSEWYFGYSYPNDDIDCEDWRSRDHLWDMTRYALEAFRNHLPYAQMRPADELVDVAGNWCLAEDGNTYAVYQPSGGSSQLNLESYNSAFEVQWFNPRTGAGVESGTQTVVQGPGWTALGSPPSESGQDWLAIVRRLNAVPVVSAMAVRPDPYLGHTPITATIAVDDADGLQDINYVLLHFFDTGWNYLGAVGAEPGSTPGVYEVELPKLPPLPAGSYPVVSQVFDSLGDSGYLVGALNAQ